MQQSRIWSKMKLHQNPEIENPPLIIVPPRPEPRSLHEMTLAAITPGRSLTSSVLGRGPTADINSLFKFNNKLGNGQFGTAYLVTEISTGESYACKVIPRSTLISEEDVEDLRREVSIMYFLAGQPNIVKIKGSFEDKKNVYIVMELCEGGELFNEINRRIIKTKIPFTERDAAQLAVSILTGIERCHSNGVMHRDLKPENFLLTTAGPKTDIRTADFGFATFFKPGDKFSRICGSALYMAPEIISIFRRKSRTSARYGPEVDIWSAGVIIYILLCGAHPFPPPSRDRTDAGFMLSILKGQVSFASPEWSAISEEAKHLVKSMLSHNPDNRPSATEALRHPWIQSASSAPLTPQSMHRFKNFLQVVCMKKFRKDAVRILGKAFKEPQLRFLALHLASRDSSTTGEILLDIFLGEIRSMAAANSITFDVASDVLEAAQKAGLSVSSRVEYSELLVVATQLSEIERQENLFKAFSLFDQDLSGFISLEELTKACAQYNLAPNLVEELTKEVNRNASGAFDYNEFVALMRKEAGGVSRKTIEKSLDDGSSQERKISDGLEEDERMVLD